MVVPPSDAWKLILALALLVAIALSAFASAPRRAVPRDDLVRLVAAAVGLYVVGGIASLTHHATLAGLVYAAGIATCALAAWLSRGEDSEDPPDWDEPADETPPPEPDGLPRLDWDDFERAFRVYADRGPDRGRDPTPVG
jgi:hypothetical protein